MKILQRIYHLPRIRLYPKNSQTEYHNNNKKQLLNTPTTKKISIKIKDIIYLSMIFFFLTGVQISLLISQFSYIFRCGRMDTK